MAIQRADIEQGTRTQSEQAFLLELSDALRPLADAGEIQASAARLLGERLGVDRAFYCEYDETAGRGTVVRNYVRDVADDLVGSYRFGDACTSLAALRAGRAVVLADTQAAPALSDEERAEYATLGLGAFIAMPLVKDGKLVAALSVSQATPRAWMPIEVALVRETTERTWDAVTRAQAETALRESEERYRLLIEQAPDGIFVAAADGRCLDVNRAGAKMFGYARREMLALSFSDLVVPTEVPRIGAEVVRFPDGAVVASEWRFRRKDGSTFVGEVVARQRPDGYLQGIVRDISERRGCEEALLHERALLGSVTAATDVMLAYLDPGFNYLWVNPAFADTCRMAPQDMVGRNHFALHPDPETEAIFCRVRDGGESACFRDRPCRFPERPSIAHGDWSLIPVKALGGAVAGLVFSLRDTTAYVRAQQALKMSEDRYRRLFENMNEGFALHEIITDETGVPCDYRFLEANAAFFTLTGLKPEEVVGRRVREVRPDIAPFWIETYGHVALDGESAHLDDHTLAPGRWYDVRAWQAGLRQFATVFSDVTDRIDAAAALIQAKEAAESANRAKSAFLANMSHEIRTPLHVSIGLAHLIRRGLTDPAQQQRVAQLCASSEHLLALLNDILDLSKIEADRLQLDRSDFRLDAVVERVQQVVEAPARAKGLAFVVDVTPDVRALDLRGDALRLAQVLINLASNAVKFTEAGRVLLTIECAAKTETEARLHFAVEDTGIGIAPEAQSRLFQPFVQADGATTREYGGSGLGLAISQRLVTLMGGTICLDSAAGQGSRFSFELGLPLGSATAAPPAPKSPAHVAGRRILLVEDQLLSQEIVFEMLEELGCEVDVASDGAEAVACAETGSYDLILMDMQMPRLDGLAATRAIRALPEHRQTPIVALTANAYAEDRRRCLEAGMTGHLGKPITPPQLAEALGHWLEPGVAEDDIAGQSEFGRALAAIPGLEIPRRMRPPARLPEYAALLRRFVDTHGGDMVRLRELLANGQRDAAHTLCHDLKGVAGLIGAKGIAVLAQELVDLLRAHADDAQLDITASQCAAALGELDAALAALPAEAHQPRDDS